MKKRKLTKSYMNTKRISLLAAAIFLLGGIFVVKSVIAAVGVTAATGGTAISADTTGVGWTTLGPIVISENLDKDFSKSQHDKTLVLKAPNGFEFSTSPKPSVSYRSSRDISGASLSISSSTITVTISTVNGSGGEDEDDTLTIGGTTAIRVRPTSGTSLASGNIYADSTGSAVIAGITKGPGGTNFGTLTMVAGSLDHIDVTPNPVTVAYGGTQNFSAQGQDKYHNPITGSSFTWSKTNGTGTGSINSSGLFTAGNSGSVTVKATTGSWWSPKSGTADVTVGVNPDIAIAQVVIDQINALPAVGDIVLGDKSAVEAARSAYNALTSAQQSLITNLSILESAEAKIVQLESVSHVATITSATYVVSAGGTGSETITSVPFGVAKIDFLAALTAGDVKQSWTTSSINDPVVSGDTLLVTAEDGETIVSYAITIDADPDISAVACDKSIIEETSIQGDNTDLNNIVGPLSSLPSSGECRSDIVWTSSNNDVVSDDGQTVNRPASGSGNTALTMTATISKGAVSDTVVFTLIVLEEDAPPGPVVKAITAFSFPDLANGSINDEVKTIAVTVPFGTDVTSLSPNITFSGERLSPESGSAQDFTTPVMYTIDPCMIIATVVVEEPVCDDVTYTVTVNVEEENVKSITSFGFASPFAEGAINEDDHTISIKVPKNTDLTALVATFETKNTETVTVNGVLQDSGITANDFTAPVTYTLDTCGEIIRPDLMIAFVRECESVDYTVTVTRLAGRKIPDPILPVEVNNMPMSISGDQEGVATYELDNGIKVKLSVMSGTIDNGSTNGGATFNVRYGTMEDSISNIYVDVTATDGNGNLIHQLLKKITISISGLFFPTDLQPLYVAYFDEVGNSWTEISGTTFDAATGTASFQVDHLTRFAAFDRSRYAIKTPASGSGEVAPLVQEEAGTVLGKVVYADGTLLRAPDHRIYVLVDNKLRYIPTLKALAKYVGQEIIDVSWGVINSYEMESGVVLGDTRYKDGTLLRGPDMRIYVLVGGKLKYISSLEELFKKYRGKEIINVTDAVLALYR